MTIRESVHEGNHRNGSWQGKYYTEETQEERIGTRLSVLRGASGRRGTNKSRDTCKLVARELLWAFSVIQYLHQKKQIPLAFDSFGA